MVEREETSKLKVWDLFVRSAHWSLGALVLGSFLTSEKDRLVHLHAKIGLTIGVLVLARAVWGLVGPAPARFRTFVRRPREVIEYARTLVAARPTLHLSHNPLGGVMVVGLLMVLGLCVVTGLMVYAGPEFQGPLAGFLSKHAAKGVKEVHEGLTGLLMGMIGLHVVGVLFSSWREGQNLVLGMITGWKRAPVQTPPIDRTAEEGARTAQQSARHGIARRGPHRVLVLAVALGVAGPARAAGSVAADLLREYEAQARRERPAFSGFVVGEGRSLHLSEHVQDGAKVSCASCHTANPRAQGRTPAGKIVDPLAPAANPARLTDRADVEKWFKRNCKQVIGRECTAEEKGNFVTWLLSA